MVSRPPDVLSCPRYREPNVRIVITDRMTKRRTLSIALAGPGADWRCWPAPAAPRNRAGLRRRPSRLRQGAGRLAAAAGRPARAGERPAARRARRRYEKRIAALQGYPVVVNLWASLVRPLPGRVPDPAEALRPLRQEGRLPRRQHRRLRNGRAKTSSPRRRSPTRATTNPATTIAAVAEAARACPDTAFYGRRAASSCYVKLGQYAAQSELEADVRRYALGDGCKSG